MRIWLLPLLLFTACQPSTPAPAISTGVRALSQLSAHNNYYPIAQGQRSTYSLEQFQNGQPNTKFREMTITVEALPSANGATQAILRRSYPDSSVQPNPSQAKVYDDRVELSRYNGRLAPEIFNLPLSRTQDYITVLKHPLTPGASWEGRSFQGGTETISVVGPETLTVPAGRYNTLKVRHHLRYDNGREDNLYYWYAPGVGMVRMEEEISMYLQEQWVRFSATGVLKQFQRP
jgi:hypothetical protein